MADVAQKCITANDIKNNSKVHYVTKGGTIVTSQDGTNRVTSVADLETKYTGRFDDPTYYTN